MRSAALVPRHPVAAVALSGGIRASQTTFAATFAATSPAGAGGPTADLAVAKAAACAAEANTAIGRLEHIVQRDEGGRGIRHLARPAGELASIARQLMSARRVTLLTGFPCVPHAVSPVPTETDGPSGTIAVCRALLKLNARNHVTVVTDACNEAVVAATCDAILPTGGGNCGSNDPTPRRWTLEVFPPRDAWNAALQTRLEQIIAGSDHLLALERASAGPDGAAHTMSGRVMESDLIAPLDQCFSPALRAKYPRFATTCVGDGGNELGMGAISAAVVAHVPNGATIVSAESADFVLACSVSNWGGYAIAGALDILSAASSAAGGEDGGAGAQGGAGRPSSPLMPTPEEEARILQAGVDAGGSDGVTMKQELSVDGMGMEVHARILLELQAVVDEAQKKLPKVR